MYYGKAILWSAEKGITTGVDEARFAPDQTVDRAQTVTFIYRASLRSSHKEFPAEQSSGTTPLRASGSPASEADVSQFTDLDSGIYYMDAVRWAVSSGLANGTGEDIFSPGADCTRAQIVTLLCRCFNLS